ncbi:glycoside hydrolase family 38 C-terminal domain-containing protein [Bifidobacterium sp. ESL0704]|uniref:alpha-mannosidase n=1 Tax=Bifidobacterium sp. ESL0704 TaxID=2983219 RepID=UPI0023F6D6C6|nr:glycoside hydrolase family 38 C-terminal domain-containing protein [Bifidobacterium sp. ESL0704]WEV53709.1 alpha-mannosidase [Bifidobacterium sp. ESL0704]
MFLVPDHELSRCDRVLQQRLDPHIHSVLCHCTLRSAANPGEPEPYRQFLDRARYGQVDFKPFAVPGLWGTTWGTTWFEVKGHIDLAEAKGRKVELVADLGWLDNRGPGFQSEGLVYTADGTAIKAVNPRNSWVPLIDTDGSKHVDIDANGDFVVYLEAAANPFVEGPTPYSPTPLGEGPTGKPDEPYTLRRMDVCVFNQDLYDYHADLEVVSSLIRQLKDDDPRYWQLAKALQRSLNIYDERDLAGTVAPARAELADVLSRRATPSSVKHTAVAHAHIDSAWLWPVRETRRKVARTVANVLAMMDEDPDFKYAMSSAQQYAWLEQEHPDLFKRMQSRIKEGRFIPVGGMWVESDGMVPAGESLIRQITFGQRYYKEHLGVAAKGVWLPDSFGYTGSWPQIARRAGFEWFLTQKISWNDTTKFPHHSFIWQGIDGTGILTHFPPADTYDSPVEVKDVIYSQKNYLDKDLSDHAILLYGFGDGGGGPTREMNSRIRRMRDLEGVPQIDFGTPDELYGKIRHDIVDDARGETPIYRGELYLELHRATLTAQQDMKRGCRQEESVLRVVEYLCAAASIKNPRYVYPREQLDKIWQTLLLNQFHDILPGSALAWAERQAREEYQRDIRALYVIADQAAAAIHEACPQLPVVRDAVVLPVEVGSEAQANWAVVSRCRAHGVGNVWKDRVADLPAGDVQLAAVANDEVEDVGSSSAMTLERHDDGSATLSNGLLTVTVESDGTVSSMVDERTGRELVAAGARLGRYELLRDEPYQWDAWDIHRDAFLMANGLDDSKLVDVAKRDSDGALVATLKAHGAGVDIDTHVILHAGARSLDFEVGVDWHTQERFLKVDLPLSLDVRHAQYEAQYGMVERPVQKNSRSDEAKFESCTHRFVRLAESGYAAAVVNATTYGSDVSPIGNVTGDNTAASIDAVSVPSRGTMVRLSLLSAPLYPDPHTDQGHHEFAWSVVADASVERTLAEASRLNAPSFAAIPAFDSLASIDCGKGSIVLDWMKMADDGSGDLILRLYEPAGGQASGTLHVCDELAEGMVCEVGELEDGESLPADLPRAVDGQVPAQGACLSFQSFEQATLRISR